MTGKILVTGANGTLGSAIVQTLIRKGLPYIAAVRDTEKAYQKLGTDAAIIHFDFSDETTYQQATEGVSAVFLLGPPLDYSLDALLTPFLHHLKTASINKVVYLSAMGVDVMSDALPFHNNIEQKLSELGFDYTILRPTFFAQNFKNYEGDNIKERKVLFSPAGNGKAAFVDVNDIAEVASVVLSADGHSQKVYTITGSETYSYDDVAGMLSGILQEPIAYPAPSTTDYAAALAAAGAPPFIADYMNSVYALIRDSHANMVTNDVELITGRKPNSLRSVLEKQFA